MITCVETLSCFASLFFFFFFLDLHKKLLGLSTTWWVGCLLLNMRSQRGTCRWMRFGRGMGVKDHIIIRLLFARQKRKVAKKKLRKQGWVVGKTNFWDFAQTSMREDACYFSANENSTWRAITDKLSARHHSSTRYCIHSPHRKIREAGINVSVKASLPRWGTSTTRH